MSKYAVIDSKTNKVWGVIKWDGAPLNMSRAPFIGRFLVKSDVAQSGDLYDPASESFSRPEPVVELPMESE